MQKTRLSELIDKIKEKKDMSGLSDELITDSLNKYFSRNNFPEVLSEKDKKIVVSDIRKELRIYSGEFNLFKKNFSDKVDFQKLLGQHSSTKERLLDYPRVIEVINEINPDSILDVGCGINPLAIAMPGKKYFALDINKDYLEIVENYFKSEKIEGETINGDIRKIEELNLPKVDLCILFKVLDVIEKKGHKIAERIIDRINAKFFISFSTKTLSGKPMNHPQRGWIERMLTRKGFKFESFKTKNEVFYVAEKLSEN